MKQLCLFVILLLTCNMFLCSQTQIGVEVEKLKIKKQPSSDLGPTLPEANSYYEGWVHYYHYNNHTTIARPKLFFQNNEFFAQRVPISQVKNSDKNGPIIIPNKSSFYLVLAQDSVQIFTSRDKTIGKDIDSLLYEYIESIPEDAFLQGGIQDLGSFAIGHCAEAKANIPNGREINDGQKQAVTWAICFDKLKEKQKFLKMFVKLKLQQQRKIGVFKTEETMKTEEHAKTMADLLKKPKPIVEREGGVLGSPRDGYWILLQNWTDCTLKCGGGESYQQWQCVPPKNGGKTCEGKAIRIKKCNEQACPSANSLLNMYTLTQPEVKKPIIKVAPFSSRLQRYSKCLIKDNDAFLATYDPKILADTKFPVRVVMNNRTFTIYKDDEYQDVEYSYDLTKTAFVIIANQFCCFDVKDSIRSSKICGYEKNCGDVAKNQWVNEWSKDFTTFKVDCNVGTQETLLSPDDEQQLAEDLRKKLGQARMDAMEDKEKKLKQQMMLGSNSSFKKQVTKTQNLGFAAIQKEMQLENLIKNEEKEKEDQEITTLLKKIEKEKEKEQCLHNTIKERDLDAEFVSEKRAAEQEIKEIKEEIHKQVEVKRANMKKLIEQMRGKAAMRKTALEAELSGLRQKMATEMLKASKNGDMEKCKKGIVDVEARDTYCNVSYIDDFVRNSDCKTDEDFCYMCCESEFGNMFIDRRESCYNMCDTNEQKKPAASPPTKGDGPWMWAPKTSQ